MDRYQYAKQQALVARERALQSGDEATRKEWLRVTELWEAIAREYLELAKLGHNLDDTTAA